MIQHLDNILIYRFNSSAWEVKQRRPIINFTKELSDSKGLIESVGVFSSVLRPWNISLLESALEIKKISIV